MTENGFAAVGAANEGCPIWFCVLPAAMVNAKALGFESPSPLTQAVGGNAAACRPCRFTPPPADCDP